MAKGEEYPTDPAFEAFEQLHEFWIVSKTTVTFEDFIDTVQTMAKKSIQKFEVQKMVPHMCTLCQWEYTDPEDRDRHIRGDNHLVNLMKLLYEERSHEPTA